MALALLLPYQLRLSLYGADDDEGEKGLWPLERNAEPGLLGKPGATVVGGDGSETEEVADRGGVEMEKERAGSEESAPGAGAGIVFVAEESGVLSG